MTPMAWLRKSHRPLSWINFPCGGCGIPPLGFKRRVQQIFAIVGLADSNEQGFAPCSIVEQGSFRNHRNRYGESGCKIIVGQNSADAVLQYRKMKSEVVRDAERMQRKRYWRPIKRLPFYFAERFDKWTNFLFNTNGAQNDRHIE